MVLPKLVPLPEPEPVDPEATVTRVLECVACHYKARLSFKAARGRKSVSAPPCPECGNGSWLEEAF